MAIDDRKTVAADLDVALPRALARTHGRLTLDPPLSGVANTAAAILRSATGILVRIQLLSARGRVLWPPSTAPFSSGTAMRRQQNLPFPLCPRSPRLRRRRGRTVTHRGISGTYGRSAEAHGCRPASSTGDSVRRIGCRGTTCSALRRERPNGGRNSPAKRGSLSTPPTPWQSYAKHGLEQLRPNAATEANCKTFKHSIATFSTKHKFSRHHSLTLRSSHLSLK